MMQLEENQTKISEFDDGKESTKQESQDKMKSKTITRLESKIGLEKTSQWLTVRKMKQ